MARLEDYELGRVLAKGGMGVVHEAVERATGRRVALKRILPGALEPDAIARFVLEGRAVARLSHRGIVRVHALDESPGGPFMVMDLVAGESLQRVLDREGPLAPAHALALARELAGALAHAHEQGVLHRDLKPANVLLDEAGATKLIDFGLAKLLGATGSLAHLTRTGEVVGTPTFMAPEQATGGATDARTDVYGLGATLFALLTGKPPFHGASAIAVLYDVTSRAPTAPSRLRPGLSPALDRLVLDCLAKDPAARPPSMAALLARLEGLQPEGGRSGARATAAAVAIAAAALVVAGVAAISPSSPPPPPTSTSTTAPTSSVPVITPGIDALAAPFLARAHQLARQGQLAAALAAPSADAPAAAWFAHGDALLSAGRPTVAARALKNSLLDSHDRAVVLARFRAAAASDPTDVSTQALDALLEGDPRWVEGLFERELHLARTALDEDRLRDAVRSLEVRGADTLAIRLRCAAADAANDAEEMKAALRALEGPGRPRDSALLLVEAASVRIRCSDDERAQVDLTRALELDPLLARAHLLRGRARRTLKDFRGAAADLGRCGELFGPASIEGAAVLAERVGALLEGGHAAEALEAAEALRGQGLTAISECLLGDALAALDRREDAIAAYERVLENALPGRPSEYEGAATGLERLGRAAPDWAVSYVSLLQRDAREDPAPWLAFAHAMRGQPEVAEMAASRAVDLRFGPEANRLRAELRTMLGQHSGALADWDEVVRAFPEDGWARYHRGRVCWTLGSRERALEDLDRALPLLASGDPSRLAVVHLERAGMRERLGHLQGALEDAREAQRLSPNGAAQALVRRLEARVGQPR